MEVSISYGGEKISFNLNSEIIIDENRINEEIKEQPSVFGFLSMLLVKLERVKNDKEKEMEKKFASLFQKYKEETDNLSGRQTNDQLAKEKAINNTGYQRTVSSFHQAKEEYGIIYACVKSFEQRHLLIQTLSANIRKG